MVFDFSCYLLRLVRSVPQTSMVFIPPWVGDVGLRLPYCSSPVLPKKDSHIYAWWLARVREEPTSSQISISTAFVYRRYDCPDFDCGLDLLLKTRKNSAGRRVARARARPTKSGAPPSGWEGGSWVSPSASSA